MNKLLRYSLSVILAFVASVGFAATYTYSFTEKVFGKSGETVDLGGIEWTATSDAGYFGFDTTDAKKGQQFGSKKKPATTLTLSTAAFKDKITAITVETAGAGGIKATLDVTVGGKAFGKQYTLTTTKTEAEFKGEETGEIVLSYKNSAQAALYISAITVTTLGEGETPQPPVVVTYTDVANVKDLLANYTEDTKNLNLTLTNAKVTYVNEYNGTINTYVREGDAAIELRTLGFNMPVNSILTGKVKVDLTFYYGVPYLVANAGTNDESITVTESTEAAQPIEATVADIIANKYLNDLVTIKGFTFSKEEYQEGRFNYYANDGEQKIMIYDKFNKVGGVAELTEGEKYNVVGLYGAIFKGTPEILPTQAVVPGSSTGISNITTSEADNAPAYNLAGQKVNAAYKGIVIKNGKKMIKK